MLTLWLYTEVYQILTMSLVYAFIRKSTAFQTCFIWINSHFGSLCSPKISLGLKLPHYLIWGHTNAFLRMINDKILSMCFTLNFERWLHGWNITVNLHYTISPSSIQYLLPCLRWTAECVDSPFTNPDKHRINCQVTIQLLCLNKKRIKHNECILSANWCSGMHLD